MASADTGRANREASFQALHGQLAAIAWASRELNERERSALVDIARRIFENEERRTRPRLRLVA